MGLCKLIVIVGVAAMCMQPSNSASIGSQNNCICTREYFPVCGSNGVTYSNKCVFACEKQTLKDLDIKFYGECEDQAAADEVLCMCTREYEPVCGTDGKTYSNKCTFKCAQKNNNALEFSAYGECVAISNLPMDQEAPEIKNLPMDGEIPEVQNYGAPCLCTREYQPVCGNDGKTYSNKCMLNCAKNTNNALEMFASGECADQTAADEVLCMCTREYEPVCGTDGKTYSNKCTFKCAQKNNIALKFASYGQCVEKAAADEVMCMCTYEYAPVCGTDSKTYANKCSLNCAKKTNKQLEVFAAGTCDQIQNFPVEDEKIQVQTLPLIQPLCICTREYAPVCGSDGHTYSNKCMIKCQQQMKSDLKLVHFGQC